MSDGLGDDWHRIEEDLRRIAPYYEKGNEILSFGRSGALRRESIERGLPQAGTFIDVGCGPGSMSLEALRLNPALEIYD